MKVKITLTPKEVKMAIALYCINNKITEQIDDIDKNITFNFSERIIGHGLTEQIIYDFEGADITVEEDINF